MNKRKWIGYIAALLGTVALVASSIYAPSALMRHQESLLVGQSHTINSGYYRSRTYAPTATPQPTPDYSSDEVSRIQKIVGLMNQRLGSKLQNDPQPGEIQMKDAVNRAVEQLQEMMKAGAILQLQDFPYNYVVNAKLQHLTDGEESIDYWNIAFSPNKSLIKDDAGIVLLMDADTGIIFSVNIWGPHWKNSIFLADTAESMAKNLGISGQIQSIPQESAGPQRVIWVSNDKSISLNLSLFTGAGGDSLTIQFRTLASPVPYVYGMIG